MPVVAPPLGAYLGGIIYLVFVGSTIPQEPPILENPMEYEDRKIRVLPMTTPPKMETSSLAPDSLSRDNRPSVWPVAPVGDSIHIEQF